MVTTSILLPMRIEAGRRAQSGWGEATSVTGYKVLAAMAPALAFVSGLAAARLAHSLIAFIAVTLGVLAALVATAYSVIQRSASGVVVALAFGVCFTAEFFIGIGLLSVPFGLLVYPALAALAAVAIVRWQHHRQERPRQGGA
jgi:peptidoglycan/LPS O-acetylase OafA/YrhL